MVHGVGRASVRRSRRRRAARAGCRPGARRRRCPTRPAGSTSPSGSVTGALCRYAVAGGRASTASASRTVLSSYRSAVLGGASAVGVAVPDRAASYGSAVLGTGGPGVAVPHGGVRVAVGVPVDGGRRRDAGRGARAGLGGQVRRQLVGPLLQLGRPGLVAIRVRGQLGRLALLLGHPLLQLGPLPAELGRLLIRGRAGALRPGLPLPGLGEVLPGLLPRAAR